MSDHTHSHSHHHHDSHTDPSAVVHPTNAEANTSTYTSSDPSADPHAKSSTKILGDVKGAVHGVTGSLQAATGTMFGIKGMQEKGFAKMSEEDQRIAAKSGKVAVGTETRGPGPGTGLAEEETRQG